MDWGLKRCECWIVYGFLLKLVWYWWSNVVSFLSTVGTLIGAVCQIHCLSTIFVMALWSKDFWDPWFRKIQTGERADFPSFEELYSACIREKHMAQKQSQWVVFVWRAGSSWIWWFCFSYWWPVCSPSSVIYCPSKSHLLAVVHANTVNNRLVGIFFV